ncbi:hypothetical protein L8C07_05770 [Paenibacillus sp. CMAA1739]|uniref:hypothetical protein n=1 Tax=Paenibacillus ottowii TaxID=2315729 RepID=UPI002DBEE0C1|nr:hypothetical protein [Paenibacillus sp. CMAA1739]MEC4565446.1 hypothetical protein [Paenibacillus sp. CMAA1739]
MDKHLVLTEILMAIHGVNSLEKHDEFPELILDNLWNAVKELCGIKAEGRFSNKVLEYVLDELKRIDTANEDPYEDLIEYLTTSKIEMNGGY